MCSLKSTEVEAVGVEEEVREEEELWDELLHVVDVVHQAPPSLAKE